MYQTAAEQNAGNEWFPRTPTAFSLQRRGVFLWVPEVGLRVSLYISWIGNRWDFTERFYEEKALMSQLLGALAIWFGASSHRELNFPTARTSPWNQEPFSGTRHIPPQELGCKFSLRAVFSVPKKSLLLLPADLMLESESLSSIRTTPACLSRYGRRAGRTQPVERWGTDDGQKMFCLLNHDNAC